MSSNIQNKENNNKKVYERVLGNARLIAGGKNNFLFSLIFVLINLCAIPILWAIVSYDSPAVDFNDAFSGVSWNFLYVILGAILLLLINSSFQDYLFVYRNTKQRRFLSLLYANVGFRYFNNTSFFDKGNDIYLCNLDDLGIKVDVATHLTYERKLISKLVSVVYFTLLFVLGNILYFDSRFIWLILIAFLSLIVQVVVVLYVLTFSYNKEKSLKFIGSLSKFLYKLRIIKNYELFYQNCVDKLILYKRCLSEKKHILVIKVLCGVVNIFLRHFIIFAILGMINFVDYSVLINVMYYAILIDLVVSIMPLKNGSILSLILFVVLFDKLFIDGYVLWGLLLYRIFDYLFYVILFVVLSLVLRVKKSKNMGIK